MSCDEQFIQVSRQMASSTVKIVLAFVRLPEGDELQGVQNLANARRMTCIEARAFSLLETLYGLDRDKCSRLDTVGMWSIAKVT